MKIIYVVHEGKPRLEYYNNNLDDYTLNKHVTITCSNILVTDTPLKTLLF
jgi:hypothetical protein